MKITIYELLGMIKDGKAPNRIKYGNVIYKKMNICNYEAEEYNIKLFDYNFFQENRLNDIVEILEEEKKIPEKITINDNGTLGFPNGEWTARNMDKAFAIKFNQLIDYLESKGE